jgi:hypothetical protein
MSFDAALARFFPDGYFDPNSYFPRLNCRRVRAPTALFFEATRSRMLETFAVLFPKSEEIIVLTDGLEAEAPTYFEEDAGITVRSWPNESDMNAGVTYGSTLEVRTTPAHVKADVLFACSNTHEQQGSWAHLGGDVHVLEPTRGTLMSVQHGAVFVFAIDADLEQRLATRLNLLRADPPIDSNCRFYATNA